jgi:hypothetical protein
VNNTKKTSNLFLLVALVFGLESCKKATSPNLATVETAPIVKLDITTVASGGIVVDDGGGKVTQRGVCWSTNPYPTINDSITIDGAGTGVFNSVVYTLKPNTQYYLRAYAVNSAGEAYGLQQTIQTTDIVLGDTYQGGIVAYINKSGDPGYISGRVSGIICAVNHDTIRSWGCPGVDLVGLVNALGSGKINTQTIIKRCSDPAFAAEYCDKLVANGYSDWFLPTWAELSECNKIIKLPGGVPFWTSTQNSANDGTVIILKPDGSSLLGWGPKSLQNKIQPIRYFITP